MNCGKKEVSGLNPDEVTHPKDDIRLAYNLFLAGVVIGILSIGLGVWGVLLGYEIVV
jgi:hypothetical protein